MVGRLKVERAVALALVDSREPISRTTLLMGHSNDHDFGLADSVGNVEVKPLNNELSCSVIGTGPEALCYTFDHGAAGPHRENQETPSG